MARGAGKSSGLDRSFVLWVAGAVVAAILLFSVFGPHETEDDPQPTSRNASSHGIEAAYLLLGESGYRAERWDRPLSGLGGLNGLSGLSDEDAAETTLVVTEPTLPEQNLEEVKKELDGFLRRGGRVVATGATGAELLPGGKAGAPLLKNELCYTTPEGPGELARVGQVVIAEPTMWTAEGPQYRVEQRCGQDAVVVRYGVGKGEAVWWSSVRPMSNGGLKDVGSVRLLVASVGERGASGKGRRVLFDEYLHAVHGRRQGLLKGLPWWSLGLQALLVGVLLVLSRGRRNGPIRLPVRVPRTSPLEFAESMGRLYGRAGATEAAVEAARERLVRVLREECGVPREAIPAGVAEVMGGRFGGDWREMESRLGMPGLEMTSKGAVTLVAGLDGDFERVKKVARVRVAVG